MGIKATIQESRMRCKDVEIYENCGCQLRTSYGLPFSHEQTMYLYQGQPIRLDAVDTSWTKLDFSPCISLDDDLDCTAELEELDTEFKKQPRAGKKSFLKMMKEIATPSTTSVGDPTTHKTTYRCPSYKKTHVEPPLQAQEPLKPTSTSIPKPPKPNVKPDGNYGFRVVAVGLDLHEDEWPTIRYRLLQELEMYHQKYVTIFGIDGCDRVEDRLDYFNINEPAPLDNWMSMQEIVLKGSKKQITQIEPVIIEGDMPTMCPQDRKDNSSTPSNPPMFEAEAPTRQAQEFRRSSKVGKQPSSDEAQHSHENTNVNSSDFQNQTQA
ncbi:hypothetical protein CTI12_AA151300 [Artemisia annua]|uniref:Uncharacterized protein n=1 Tax=Artemisia annua TaxID=35608 RepID=A0A2U1PHJ6_ARTAN|nr:hypothetical protein CTI12_AA151300 [Artemisia annua]